jgi:alpha-L-rhamnosidase
VTSTAFYFHHARILSDLAKVLGKTGDAAAYAALADSVRQAFVRRFVHLRTGEVFTRTQACQVTALYYDLLPDSLRRRAFQVLLDEIFVRHKGHLSTGIFTTKMMLDYLGDLGRDDVAFAMMNQKEYPGFGYMLDNGATTLWENWEFEQHDSKNHPMFGSVSEWLHHSILGIQQADTSVAFRDIIIRPAVVGDLAWARGHYDSVRGRIASSWWKYGDDLIFEVEIPANARARIFVPLLNKPRPDIYEGPTPLVRQGAATEADPQIRLVQAGRGYYEFSVGAGRYRFEVR